MPNVTPPPVPTRSQVLDSNGLASRPWIAWFTTLGQLFGYYQTVQKNGTAVPQEFALNFTGAITVTDNPTNGSTDISVAASPFSVQFGSGKALGTSNDYATVDVVFPTPFASIPKVVFTPNSFPRGTNTPMTHIASAVSEAGFTANFACAVPTGGGGSTIDQDISFDWIAITNA